MGGVNSLRTILNLFGILIAQKVNNKTPKLHIMILVGLGTASVITAAETGVVEYFWPFIIMYMLKALFTSMATQNLNPTIQTSVPAKLIHKVNGLGTTLNTLVQCIGSCFISMILQLFDKADQYVNGLYTSMGVVLFCMVVNIMQTIYFFLLKPQC